MGAERKRGIRKGGEKGEEEIPRSKREGREMKRRNKRRKRGVGNIR